MRTKSFYICWDELAFYLGGKIEGKYILWYKNGHKYIEDNYKNGQLHGDSIQWFLNGEKVRIEEWVNGKLIA